MGLIATIGDPAWRAWAHALPAIDRRNPEVFATYLLSLEQALEDAPLNDKVLTADDLRSLLPLLNSHRQTIAMELLRLARRARESTVPGATGGLISALWRHRHRSSLLDSSCWRFSACVPKTGSSVSKPLQTGSMR